MSVVTVLRPSYYLVIDLQSEAAIAASPHVVVFPIAPFLILQCIVELSPIDALRYCRYTSVSRSSHPQ